MSKRKSQKPTYMVFQCTKQERANLNRVVTKLKKKGRKITMSGLIRKAVEIQLRKSA